MKSQVRLAFWPAATIQPVNRTCTLLPLLLTTALPVLCAQHQRVLPSPQEFVTTQDDSLFSLTRSQEDVHAWEQAREEIAAGNFATGVERLHRVLQSESGGAVSIGPNRFVSLRLALVMELANLPPAGTAAYEDLVRREAGALLAKDPAELLPEQARMLAERFPAAAHGRRARLRLGDLALERGDGAAAATHFLHALAASPIGSELERAVEARQRRADALERSSSLRGRGDLSAEAIATLEALPAAQDLVDWTAAGGGLDGARPMTDPAGKPTPSLADALQATNYDSGNGASFAMHAIGGMDAVYVNTGMELLAFDPLRGQLLWASPSPVRDASDARTIRDYGDSVNPSMVLAAAASEDVIVAALQVPDQSTSVRYQNAFTIMQRIPERRLFAFHRATGKLLWSHFDSLDGPVAHRFRGHAASGPPLIVGDTVYAPVHDRSGAIAFYVGAYDLRTGQPRWRRLVCSSQQEVNMFGNARQEFAASPLCEADGLVFGASNLGVCYAIDRDSGRLQWLTSYEVIRMPPTQMQGQDARPVFFHNSPPACCDGVVAFTPLDSEAALGIDAATGEPLWALPHEARAGGNNDVRWLCGAIDSEFIFSGAGVVAVAARQKAPQMRAVVRQLCSRDALFDDEQNEFPRPAVTRSRIYLPRQDSVKVLDIKGTEVADAPRLEFVAPGNLLLVDGIAISLRNGAFETLVDASALRERARARMEATPDDPGAILRVCTLEGAAGGSEKSIEALCRRGASAAKAQGLPREHPLHATFLRRLFESALARAIREEGNKSIDLLVEARDSAPDQEAFLRAQSNERERVRADDSALRRELETLRARARGETFALPEALGPVEVEPYVRWRLARLEREPKARLLAWQDLLQSHGEATLLRRPARDLAHDAIAALLRDHGAAIYAEVEARAAASLDAAGEDARGLRTVCSDYPHSAAARRAETRLLDAAVAEGDLGTALDVWATTMRAGKQAPGVARRAAKAATSRGNRTLARRLLATILHENTASDWPADNGKTFADVARAQIAELAAVEPRPVAAIPTAVIAELTNPAPPSPMRALPVREAEGFRPASPSLLFVSIEEQVRAIDLSDPALPTRYSLRTGGVERLWSCGDALIVPTLERIDAVDSRTGKQLWQMAFDDTLLVCHGVIDGVLLVTQRRGDDRVTLVGVEPLTGRELFERDCSGTGFAPQPRATSTDLLLTHSSDEGPTTLLRIDPLTGATTAEILLGDELREASMAPPEVIQSPLLLQRFFADRERVYLPLDGALRGDGAPALIAVDNAGKVAWQWNGEAGQSLAMEGLCAGRIVVVAAGSPARSGRTAVQARAVVLDAKSGTEIRRVALGLDLQVLNWRRQRTDVPAPERLLLSDLDPDTGDRRFVAVPLQDGEEPFQTLAGSSTEEVIRTPWLRDGILCFATHSRRSTGPVRVYALNAIDRSSAMPGRRTNLMVPTQPRSTHELADISAYTVLVTDSRIYLLGTVQGPK